MRGEGSSGVGKVAKSRETMMIAYGETDDQPGKPFMTFYATPAGSARTFFRWVASETKLTFVNEAHDYPQRIRYWREGKNLIAEVSLADGSKSKRWRYTAMGR